MVLGGVVIIPQCDLIGASAADNIRKITQLPQLGAMIQDPQSEKAGRLPRVLKFMFVHHASRPSGYESNLQLI